MKLTQIRISEPVRLSEDDMNDIISLELTFDGIHHEKIDIKMNTEIEVMDQIRQWSGDLYSKFINKMIGG